MPLAAGHRNSIFFFMFNLNFVSASAAFFFLNSGFFLLSQGVPRNSLLSFSYRKKPSSFAVSHFFLAWFVLLSTFVFVAFFTLTSNLSNGTDASSGKGDCTCSLTLFFLFRTSFTNTLNKKDALAFFKILSLSIFLKQKL